MVGVEHKRPAVVARHSLPFWTIVASIAGVIGAAAAVYPLINADHHPAHLTFPDHLDRPRYVWVENLSDPIVLTGNWYIKRGQWWNTRTLRTGDVIGRIDSTSYTRRNFRDLRVTANERKMVSIDSHALEDWAGGALTPCSPGEFDLGLEFKSKAGSSWAYTTLPFCIAPNIPPGPDLTSEKEKADLYWPENKTVAPNQTSNQSDADAYWPKDWQSMMPSDTRGPERPLPSDIPTKPSPE